MGSRPHREGQALLATISLLASGVPRPGAINVSLNDTWEVASQNTCQGAMTEYGDCIGLPPCGDCVPVDCGWNTWANWFPGGGCTGICIRQREIYQQNNECGTPCNGAKTETKSCPNQKCLALKQDCQLSSWGQWAPSTCTNPTDQKFRERHIVTPPANGGEPCETDTKQTAPCLESPSATDCTFTSWHTWTTCSKPCNGGRKSRVRRVLQDATQGGKPCEGVLEDTMPCNMYPCKDAQNCALSQWQAWSGCHDQTPNQKFRSREVDVPANKGGVACDGPLKETVGCSQQPKDCTLTQWSQWQACDQTCDGGQKIRTRSILAPATDGGKCPQSSLRETLPCNTKSCSLPGPNDCQMSTWDQWSECSAKCGWGLKERNRRVTSLAQGGKGCQGSLQEVAECEQHRCQKVDCKWGQWSAYSDCTCTCGGGTKRRTRVVEVAPENGGADCAVHDKAEVAPCATIPCSRTCIDGAWGQWSQWSTCSATCDEGFKSRRRDLQQEPNVCGRPAGGKAEEYLKCTTDRPCVANKDCTLSGWGQWSACSCTCFGVRERHRTVTQFRSGDGKACVEASLKTIEPCSPGVGGQTPAGCEELAPLRDCKVDQWTMWSECSATCGGGQKSRSRHILVPPSGGGLPCTLRLAETTACNSMSCAPPHCMDCRWGQWSAWGGCTKCGGQRWRHRSVEQLPNYCGQRCDPRSAKEVGHCQSYCEPDLYCAWSEWSSFAPCPSQCGSATTRRHRALGLHKKNMSVGDYLYKGSGSLTCTGTQFYVKACDTVSCGNQCVPRDCRFDEWSQWGAPTCTGLCERHRVISQTNNECGDPCRGPLIATKRCTPDCVKPQDCVLGLWGMWGHCSTAESQRYRIRGIKQMPAHGGEPCRGPLRETAGCDDPSNPPQDCELSQWSQWGECSKSCGSGWRTRNRRISAPAQGGGQPCTDSLEELMSCDGKSCPARHSLPCELGQWLQWSGCKSNGQKYRQRNIIRYALGNGAGCKDNMEETMACSAEDADCRVGPWTQWAACDVSCGGGQTERHRQVDNYPHLGGKPCDPGLSLMQTAGCNDNVRCAPSNDCQVGKWDQWSICSATCGVGQMNRKRVVIQLRHDLGVGCNEALSETKTCAIKECLRTNCLWSVWSHWSSCSRGCGGGERTRERHITQAPSAGGVPCVPQDKEEMEACNTQKCTQKTCIDGEWGEWANWEPCSRTCDGGITWRSRKVSKPASPCGKAPEGLSQEVGACNKDAPCQTDLDCVLSTWEFWSACSASCFGVKTRNRNIQTHGRGNGKFCFGALKETAPCSPGEGENAPLGCPVAGTPVDCVISSWLPWATCTATCGGGQRTRERKIITESQKGGAACRGDLGETGKCGEQPCPNVGNTKVNCQWGLWSMWGACDRCGGQRKRFRHVDNPPKNGGASCTQKASEETEPCPRHCHTQYYCAWAQWEQWDACTSTCGHGKRSRKRHLAPQLAPGPGARLWEEQSTDASSSEKVVAHEEDQLHALYRRQKQIEENRFLELSMAFACGCLTLMVGLFASRACSRFWQNSVAWGYSANPGSGPVAPSAQTSFLSSEIE